VEAQVQYSVKGGVESKSEGKRREEKGREGKRREKM
jgi:hypothetical protein